MLYKELLSQLNLESSLKHLGKIKILKFEFNKLLDVLNNMKST